MISHMPTPVPPVYCKGSAAITQRSLMVWVYRMVEQRAGKGSICMSTISRVYLEGNSDSYLASMDLKRPPEL